MIKMEQFKNRHIGVNETDKLTMLETLLTNVDELISQTIPSNIRLHRISTHALSEQEYAEEITNIATKTKYLPLILVWDGMTYHASFHIQKCVWNPVWYALYTLSGNCKADLRLCNFQTIISDLMRFHCK